MIKIQINFKNRERESETYSFPTLKENRWPPCLPPISTSLLLTTVRRQPQALRNYMENMP